MSYRDYSWEVISHDFASPFLRNWMWVHSYSKYPRLLGIAPAGAGIVSRHNEIEYVADNTAWTAAFQALTGRVVANGRNLEDVIEKLIVAGERLNAWTDKNIFSRDLGRVSANELVLLLRTAIDMEEDVNVYGTALSIPDYQSFSFIDDKLQGVLRAKAKPEKVQEFYSLFTEPECASFAQTQEEELLELMTSFWSDGALLEDIRTKDLEDVAASHGGFWHALSDHARKHAWVYYGYMGPAFSEAEFFLLIRDYVKKGSHPLQESEDRRQRRANILAGKAAALRELAAEGFDAFILRIASRVVWAKPRRKDYQSRSLYHIEKLAKEIARRLFISLDQVWSAPIDVLEQAFVTGSVDEALINSIKQLHICLPNRDGSVSVLTGPEAEEFSARFIQRKANADDLGAIEELRGTTACRGNAVGRAKIINLPTDMLKMEDGDILVSSSTAPGLVAAMKKAAAIVTDVGGLTCHAAIVSRELNIPCIVGLKVVTKIVQDGDILAVDADKGEIRKLKQAPS